MTFLARYKKALAALVVGVAAALALLPTDADPRLLALIPVANLLAVALAPANAGPPTGIISSKPTTYVRPPPVRRPGDPLE
jgi:hypothetical protein